MIFKSYQITLIFLILYIRTDSLNAFFTHEEYGSSVTRRPLVHQYNPREMVIPDPKDVFKTYGKIHHWSFYARLPGAVYVQIWRKQSRYMYMLVQQYTYYVHFAGVHRVRLRIGERGVITPGDVVGFYTNRYGVIPYDNVNCSAGQSRSMFTRTTHFKIHLGNVRYFPMTSYTCRKYSLNVVVQTKAEITIEKDQEYGSDSIYRFHIGHTDGIAFISNSKEKSIANGYLIKWQFYALRTGTIYLQIWEPLSGTEYRLLHQTMHVVRNLGVNVVSTSSPTFVPKGSIMGFHCPRESIIPFDSYSCDLKQNVSLTFSGLHLRTNQIYSFRPAFLRCRKHSIRMKLTEENELLKDYGNTASHRLYKDLEANKVLIPEPHHPLPNGRLVFWEIFAATPGDVDVQVWRPLNVSNTNLRYKLINQTTIHATSFGQKIRIFHEVPVNEGDVIGFLFKERNIIPFDGIPCQKPGYLYIKKPMNIQLNADLTFNKEHVIWNKCRVYSITTRVIGNKSREEDKMSALGQTTESTIVTTVG